MTDGPGNPHRWNLGFFLPGVTEKKKKIVKVIKFQHDMIKMLTALPV